MHDMTPTRRQFLVSLGLAPFAAKAALEATPTPTLSIHSSGNVGLACLYPDKVLHVPPQRIAGPWQERTYNETSSVTPCAMWGDPKAYRTINGSVLTFKGEEGTLDRFMLHNDWSLHPSGKDRVTQPKPGCAYRLVPQRGDCTQAVELCDLVFEWDIGKYGGLLIIVKWREVVRG